jgi:hypothetical protein
MVPRGFSGTNSNQAMRNGSRERKLSPGEILTPAGRDERPIQVIGGETTSLRSEWR